MPEAKTLEDHLRERLSDSRAMIGSLDINADRVFLHFGAIGDLARITLSINDNEISIATPSELRDVWQEEDAAKRYRPTALDEAAAAAAGKPIEASYDADREKLVAPDGRDSIIPDEFYADVLAAAQEAAQGDNSPPAGEGDADGGGDGADDSKPAEPVDPDKMTKAALIELAAAEGVEVKGDDTKAEIAAAINAKRASAAEAKQGE